MRFPSNAIACALLLTWSSPVVAGDAESLFDEARALLREGKTSEACDKLAASVSKFDERGVAKLTAAAMINLADCREQNKQLATAWSTFLATATLAQNNALLPVATEARRRAGLLQPRLSTLTVAVADANRVEGLSIARSGVPVESAQWNQGVPVDGGSYVITASAPQNAAWSATIEVPAEAGRITLEIPRLKQLRDLAPSVAPPVAVERTPQDAERTYTLTPLHWTGIGVAAAGVLGIGAGVYFGREASKISDEASAWQTFDASRFAEGNEAQRNALVALGAGTACVVAGGVLFYLGHRATIAPVISHEGAGVVAAGRF